MGHHHNHDHNHDHKHDHNHDHSHDHNHDHSYDHNHDHCHDHNHDHCHCHGQNDCHQHSEGQADGQISTKDKIVKRIEHWIKHNNDHVNNYNDWAQKAKAEGLDKVSSLLIEVANMSQEMNNKFEEALKEAK